MQLLKKSVASLMLFSVVVFAAAIVAPQTARGDKPDRPDAVTVVNPTSRPVPVAIQGALPTLSASVKAQQDGLWNVGITGMPDVNIANTPTVNLGTGNVVGVNGAVQVGNPANNPVLVRDVDNSAQFGSTIVDGGCTIAVGSQVCTSAVLFVVPVGQRAVVETISAEVKVAPGQKAFVILGIQNRMYRVPVTSQGVFFSNETLAALQAVRLYAGPGDQIAVRLIRDDTDVTGVASLAVTLSGFIVQ